MNSLHVYVEGEAPAREDKKPIKYRVTCMRATTCSKSIGCTLNNGLFYTTSETPDDSARSCVRDKAKTLGYGEPCKRQTFWVNFVPPAVNP